MPTWELPLDYDEYSDIEEIYNLFWQHSEPTRFSTQRAHDGSKSVMLTILPGESGHGNALLDVGDWGLQTNSHGRAHALRQSFWFYLPENFRLHSGTEHRFWGSAFAPGDGSSGGGVPDGTNGWTVRPQLYGDGGPPFDIVEYIYHMDGPTSFDVYDASVQTGQWHHIETYCESNTISNGTANADGKHRLWLDGDLILSTDGWRFTTTPANKIKWGGPITWHISPQDTYRTFYDGHAVDTTGQDPNTAWGPPTSSGNGGNGGGGGGDTDARLLALITVNNASLSTYTFRADGLIEKTDAGYDSPSGGSIFAGNNDTITQEGGRYVATGETGNGYGDAYLVHGPITDINLDNDAEMWLELDGTVMTAQEVIDATSPDVDPSAPVACLRDIIN